MGDISLSVGLIRHNWKIIFLASKNVTGYGKLGKPEDILLTVTVVVENKGMVTKK